MSNMKKFLEIVDGSDTVKKTNLQEAVSFNLSMSGDAPADVAEMFNKIMGLAGTSTAVSAPVSVPPMSKSIDVINKMSSPEVAEEKWANQDDPEYKDVDYMTKDLAGGMNRPKKMHKHSYKQGDNPMAMEESLMAEYKKFKLGE